MIPVGGTVGNLFLSPDRQWLFYLNLTDAKVGKINTKTARRDKELKLADGTDVLTRTPDGKTLIATAPVKDGCKIQIIDPKTLELRKSFWVDVAAYDVAANDAGLLFLSGGKGEWSDIAVVDVAKEAVVTRWGGVWNRSFVQLSADQKRLYYSSQGVSPGTLDALVIPAKFDDKPATYRAAFPGRQPLGGEFQMTPDGRYLLCKTGTILRLSANRDDDLKFHTSLEPFLAATVDADTRAAFVLTRDGTAGAVQLSGIQIAVEPSHRRDGVPGGERRQGRQAIRRRLRSANRGRAAARSRLRRDLRLRDERTCGRRARSDKRRSLCHSVQGGTNDGGVGHRLQDCRSQFRPRDVLATRHPS